MSLLRKKTFRMKTENPCVPGSIPGGTTQDKTPLNKGVLLFYTKIDLL